MKYWWQFCLAGAGVLLLIIIAMNSLPFLMLILGFFAFVLFGAALVSLLENDQR